MKMSSQNCQQAAPLNAFRLIIITITLIAVCAQCTCAEPQPPSIIVFYMGINGTTMEANLAIIASMENSSVSGLLQGYEFPMSSSIKDVGDEEKRIGTLKGPALFVSTGSFAMIGAQGELLLGTIIYDDGVFKGSICMRGHFVNTANAELAVVGGTKAFRRVQGYAHPTVLSESPLIEQWELHLFYP